MNKEEYKSMKKEVDNDIMAVLTDKDISEDLKKLKLTRLAAVVNWLSEKETEYERTN